MKLLGRPRTYFIVEQVDSSGSHCWEAYGKGILSTFGVYNIWNLVCGTRCYASAEDCENYLRKITLSKKWKPVVVRVVKV
jgi:hypothetical protein